MHNNNNKKEGGCPVRPTPANTAQMGGRMGSHTTSSIWQKRPGPQNVDGFNPISLDINQTHLNYMKYDSGSNAKSSRQNIGGSDRQQRRNRE